MSETQIVKQEKLQGRVAQILNARELVINIGKERGVVPKMRFAVLSEIPVEVYDPETNELLDTVDREKVRVEATEVKPKITICKTYRVTRIPGGAFYQTSIGLLGVGDFLRPPRVIPETLDAKDSSLPPPLSPEESFVKINDRVVLVDDDDD